MGPRGQVRASSSVVVEGAKVDVMWHLVWGWLLLIMPWIRIIVYCVIEYFDCCLMFCVVCLVT